MGKRWDFHTMRSSEDTTDAPTRLEAPTELDALDDRPPAKAAPARHPGGRLLMSVVRDTSIGANNAVRVSYVSQQQQRLGRGC